MSRSPAGSFGPTVHPRRADDYLLLRGLRDVVGSLVCISAVFSGLSGAMLVFYLGTASVGSVVEQISKALERLRNTTPITVLLGEQNVTFALPHADRVYVLDHGRITWEGEPSQFATEAGIDYL